MQKPKMHLADLKEAEAAPQAKVTPLPKPKPKQFTPRHAEAREFKFADGERPITIAAMGFCSFARRKKGRKP